MTTKPDASGKKISKEVSDDAKRKCFVITPISDARSDIRDETDGLMDAVIVPVLNELEFAKPIVSHRLARPGSINDQVIRMLLEFDLVVANLTELNPNVMYELAVRHAIRKPVVMIAKDGTKLPFDLYGERTVSFRNSFSGTMDLRRDLRSAIDEALAEAEPDNPIYRVANKTIIEGSAERVAEAEALLKAMRDMETRILQSLSSSAQPETDSGSWKAIRFTLRGPADGKLSAFSERVRYEMGNRLVAKMQKTDRGATMKWLTFPPSPDYTRQQAINGLQHLASELGLEIDFSVD